MVATAPVPALAALPTVDVSEQLEEVEPDEVLDDIPASEED
jgi:hypothetical protein